ncbi:MAG: hypothetical protein AB1646_19760 [Thermodesulfobacteriota bacterium]
MAIDSVQLVRDQLDAVLELDPAIGDVIPRQVEAQTALQGYDTVAMSDAQRVYVAILATKGMIPRLLLKFSQEVQEAEGGPAKVKFQEAVEFLKALQAELKEQVKQAAKEADPEDATDLPGTPWPGCGMRRW